jgi:Peptidase family M41
MTKREESKARARQALAYHEAGHAVMALRNELHSAYVTIVPNAEQESLGHCAALAHPDDFRPDVELSPKDEVYLRTSIEVYLAGDAAWARLMGRHNWQAASNDYHQAVDLATYMTGDIKETEAYLKWLRLRVEGTIGQPLVWAQVQAVAAALLARETLSEDEVRAVLFQAFQQYHTDTTGRPWPTPESVRVRDTALFVAATGGDA